MSSPSSSHPVIVIVGAGFAGVVTFNELSKKADPNTKIVLVNPRSHLIHLPAACRLVVSESEQHYEDKCLLPFTERFNEGNRRTVYSKVASITDTDEEKFVVLEDGEKIEFTYLVLCPGSLWQGPLNFPDTKEETVKLMKEWYGRFEKAQDIVLVGGGGVAFEYAGEIKDEYPTKNVTIVHSRQLLLNDVYPDRWRRMANTNLEKRGIRLVLGERVDDLTPKDGMITTRSGKEIPCDLLVPSLGPRPNTAFIGSSLGTDSLTESGHVKVHPTLQLPGHPRIFAAGDVVDWNEQKSARKAYQHALVVVANLLTLLTKPETTQEGLKPYYGAREALLLTNGKNGGTGYWGILWGLTFGDWMTAKMASQNLYIPGVNRLLNLPPGKSESS